MPIQPGHSLLHYRFIEKIGEGGMGTVWKAVDTRLEREIAVKFLPEAVSEDLDRLARFKQEAKVLAALNHANIVTIYSVEQSGGVHFITMELVPGRPLTASITPEGVPLGRFFDIAVPLLKAVGSAHQKGVTHRDLKPDNVIVGDDGSLRVLDFGLARLRQPSAAAEDTTITQEMLTREGRVLGTVPYMAPEQLQGKDADPRADIFALGVIFYEMLGGRRPFQGETAVDLMSSILKDEPTPITEIRPEMPERGAWVIARCLEKNPANRFQTAADLCTELDRLKHDSGRASVPTIVVLPFADMSAEKDQDYFCEGMAEEISNALGKLDGLRVTSRTSTFAIRQLPVLEIGKALGVNHVLEGSVRKAGDRLRITAQLVNVSDDVHLWSERYDRELKDVFTVQDEIAANVVEALKVTLGSRERNAVRQLPADKVEAYDFYLRGRKAFHRMGKRDLELAGELFWQATKIDPGYVRAYCGVADCRSYLYMYADPSTHNREQALEFSRIALERAPDLAEAHASHGLALSVNQKRREAEREFKIAIGLDPQLFEAYFFYARTRFADGEFEDASQLFERASEVSPDNYQAPHFLALTYKKLGRNGQSVIANRKAVKLVEKHLAVNPNDVRALGLGAGSLRDIGQLERAREWSRKALELGPDNALNLYNGGCMYCYLGDLQAAIDCLERAVGLGFNNREWFEKDPVLDPLRDHPRFVALIGRMEQAGP